MAVGFNVGFFWYQIGSGSFLHTFFSTIAVNLENSNWGSRFPLIMNKLYQGSLESEYVNVALMELDTIEEELGKLPPNKVIWDIDDIKKQPPWGDNISKDITDLSNYFVTSDGEDFLTIFRHALEKSQELGLPIEIGAL